MAIDCRIQDLINAPTLQRLLDSLSAVSGIAFAIIDLEGTILVRSGWQDICTKFHRVNLETEPECIQCIKTIVNGETFSPGHLQATCPQGLTLIATPLIIDGNLLANVFTGQVFLAEPDREFFRQQARESGFDEQAYLAALVKVPVITQKKLDEYLSFVADLATSLASHGLSEIKSREMQLAFRESGIKLQAMLDNIPDLVWLKDHESRFLMVNEAFGRACGQRPEDLVGKTDLDVWPHELAERYRQDDFDVMAQGRRKQVEEPLAESDGQIRWIETIKTPIRDESGTVIGTTGIARDITERKQAEATILNEREQAQRYLDTAGVMLVVLDTQGQITLVNRKGCAILGYDEQELLGRNWFDVCLPKAQFDEVMGVFRKLMQGDLAPVEYYENYVLTKAGDERRIAFHNTLICDQQGGIVGILFSGEDVTERKLQEEERLMLERRLEQSRKAESLGRMAGAIAHLFNNQLFAVMGNLDFALEDLPQDSDARHCIVESKAAAVRAAEISRLMLLYLGQTSGQKKPLDLGKAIREFLPLLNESIPAEVFMKTEIPPQGPFILGDNGHLKQILRNLITNAAEAIGGGKGEIALALRIVSKDQARGVHFLPLEWKPGAEEYVCLSISDTGCGVNEASLDKIFDPFFSTKFTGRGLGLPVVLGLVRAHDGAISVESQPGKGTTFQIFFPLHART